MGFSTTSTAIMNAIEAASIYPSIAQPPLDSRSARYGTAGIPVPFP